MAAQDAGYRIFGPRQFVLPKLSFKQGQALVSDTIIDVPLRFNKLGVTGI